MLKYFYYIIIALVLVFIQQSVLTASDILINLNLLLVSLVFITMIFGFNLGFIFAIFIGFFINLYSFLPFGTFIIIYLLIITAINFLYKNVLINFSFYTSLILIFLATCIYGFLLYFFSLILNLIGLIDTAIIMDKMYFVNFSRQILFNLILMVILFIIAKTTISKLKLAFLFKK